MDQLPFFCLALNITALLFVPYQGGTPVLDTPAEGPGGWMSHTHGLIMHAIERAQILTEDR